MSKAAFELEDVAKALRSISGGISLQVPQSRRAPPHTCSSGSKQHVPMEHILKVLPKHKLTRDDFNDAVFVKLKEAVDLEASLSPEHVPLINRDDLIGTLRATAVSVDEIYSKPNPPMGQVQINTLQNYSSARLKKLSRINVSDMMIRKTYKGPYLLCRTICPPTFDAGVGFLLGVEDPQGDTAYLKLFNHAMLLEANWGEHQAILPEGTILIIREPTYVSNASVTDLPFVKIDSPSDVVFVDSGHAVLQDVSWKSNLEITPRPSTGEAWKAQAVQHVKAARWFAAAICFTNCFRLGFEIQISRLNRAEIYLHLGWNNSALHDAQNALKSGELSEELVQKAVIRIIRAQYAMGRYCAVLEAAKTLPDDETVVGWVTRTNKRIEEQNTGNYDWEKLFRASAEGFYSPDVADFTGPVETKKGPNGLRGTFVSRDVKAGELLLLHKPVSALRHSDESHIATANLQILHVPALARLQDRNTYRNFSKVMLRLWDDRQMYDTVRSLYAGESQKKPTPFPPAVVGSRPLEHPTRPTVDIDVEHVFGAVVVNSFAIGNEAIAFYAVPSLLNHSCIPTANRQFIGDALVLRATQDMKKGDEVTIAYIDPAACYDEKRYRFMKTWRFNCECNLCQADDEDGYEARETRRSLLKMMDGLRLKLDKSYDVTSVQRMIAEAKTTLDALRETYNSGHSEKARGIKYELALPIRIYADVCDWMGRFTNDLAYSRQALELKMEALTLTGLRVTDYSTAGELPGESTKDQSPPFPVDTTQLLGGNFELMTIGVLGIVSLFKDLGEENRAKRWFGVAIWLEKVRCGGSVEMFKLHHSTTMSRLGLTVSEFL